MKRSILILKGYSKNAFELAADRAIINKYVSFFCSNAGGCYNLNTEIIILEEPDIDAVKNLERLNSSDYLIFLLMGHGASKDGKQIFQIQKNLFVSPGQIQFTCKRQVHILETCREVFKENIKLETFNNLIPKYKYGGQVAQPLTRDQSKTRYNEAIKNSKEGVLYMFAANIGEQAHDFLFLKFILKKAKYIHEFKRGKVVSARRIFELAKKHVIKSSDGLQTPVIVGESDFPFVITII